MEKEITKEDKLENDALSKKKLEQELSESDLGKVSGGFKREEDYPVE